jgi:YD repeat-containing protein
MPSRIRHGLLIGITVIGLFFTSVLTSYAETINYIYDELNRLVRVEYGNGTVIEYTYDKTGNRLEKTIQAPDTIPPVTTASPTGGIYNSAQSVTLTCNDGWGSGCDKIYYTVDGSTPNTSSPIYSSPINIAVTTTLKFFARDLAGNSESVKTQTYTIDTTAPTTTASPGGGFYGAPQAVTLTCDDGSGSGCDKIYHTTDGSTPTTSSPVYSSPINISVMTTLKFFSRDFAGNSETVKTEIYTLDTTLPTGTITIDSGAALTNSTTVTLTLSCNDANGCSQMQFSNDNITYSTPEPFASTKVWTLSPGDGIKTVYIKFRDAAGNWSNPFIDTITACSSSSARIGSTSYTTLQAAYNAAGNGDIIKCLGMRFIENLTVNRNITVTLEGGYDCGYATNIGGVTFVKGVITTTVGGGTITIRNFVLEK